MRSSLSIAGSSPPAARPRHRPHLAADTVGSAFLTQNLPCPCPLAQGAVGVCLCPRAAGSPPSLCVQTHEECRLCLCCEPRSQCLYSRPEAQDVSKSLLLELAGWPGPAPVCSLSHPTLLPASSSLRHPRETPRFSGWPYLLSLLWAFCSCLCLSSPPVERNVSTVRLC